MARAAAQDLVAQNSGVAVVRVELVHDEQLTADELMSSGAESRSLARIWILVLFAHPPNEKGTGVVAVKAIVARKRRTWSVGNHLVGGHARKEVDGEGEGVVPPCSKILAAGGQALLTSTVRGTDLCERMNRLKKLENTQKELCDPQECPSRCAW